MAVHELPSSSVKTETNLTIFVNSHNLLKVMQSVCYCQENHKLLKMACDKGMHDISVKLTNQMLGNNYAFSVCEVRRAMSTSSTSMATR